MKVFVYSKKSSKKVAAIVEVVNVKEIKSERLLTCTTVSGETFTFNTCEVKTTIYQN